MNIVEYTCSRFIFCQNKKFYTVTSIISFHKNGFRRSKSFSIALFDKRRFIQICSLLFLISSSFDDRCEGYDGWSVVLKRGFSTFDVVFNLSFEQFFSTDSFNICIDVEEWFGWIFSCEKETIDERNGNISSLENSHVALPLDEIVDRRDWWIKDDGLFITLVLGEVGD